MQPLLKAFIEKTFKIHQKPAKTVKLFSRVAFYHSRCGILIGVVTIVSVAQLLSVIVTRPLCLMAMPDLHTNPLIFHMKVLLKNQACIWFNNHLISQFSLITISQGFLVPPYPNFSA